jgi:6-phosphogluconolactonase
MSHVRPAVFVYVGNSGSQDITVLELEPDGNLRLVETVKVAERPAPAGSLPLAVSPDRRFLFAGLREAPYTAATYAIDTKTGRLSYVGAGELAASMVYLTTDRTGRFLLSASYHGDVVAVNPIGANGVIGTTLQKIPTWPNAHCVLVAPTNRFVLSASLGGDVMHQQKLDPRTGTLSPNDPPAMSVQPNAGPRHFVFSPAETFVYLLNELDGSIYVFPYDPAAGRLQEQVQIASSLPDGFTGKPWAADIHITPDGRFLYTSERRSSTLAAFRVHRERGTLTALGSVPTATQPRAFATDPRGRYLLAIGQVSNSIARYAIDHDTGSLGRLGEDAVGTDPGWVEIIELGA